MIDRSGYFRDWYGKNRERILAQQALYVQRNPDQVKTRQSSYREKNREALKQKNKKWYEENKQQIQEKRKVQRDQTKAKRSAYAKDYVARNREKVTSYRVDYARQRRREDLNFKLAHNLRARLRTAIKRNFKAGSAVRDLGCSISDLRDYLATKFTEGMSWTNYGEWHIDHVKPLVGFDLTDPEQLKVAVHFSNLQPLWASENCAKGGR